MSTYIITRGDGRLKYYAGQEAVTNDAGKETSQRDTWSEQRGRAQRYAAQIVARSVADRLQERERTPITVAEVRE
jgi:hypothetical protein